jgi:hypothetical protein
VLLQQQSPIDLGAYNKFLPTFTTSLSFFGHKRTVKPISSTLRSAMTRVLGDLQITHPYEFLYHN